MKLKAAPLSAYKHIIIFHQFKGGKSMKRKFAILLSAMLLTQAVCGCGGAAPSASASTGSTASKSSKKAVIVPDGFIENLNAQPIQNKK